MRGRTTMRALVVAALLTSVVSCQTVTGGDVARRVAERGPSALIVGAIFLIASPPGAAISAYRRQPVDLQLCRLGHGLEMIAASVVTVPAGVVLAPFYWRSIPGSWLDGVVDAFQEDYCTRPVTSVLP